jgi:hypothetical protein
VRTIRPDASWTVIRVWPLVLDENYPVGGGAQAWDQAETESDGAS